MYFVGNYEFVCLWRKFSLTVIPGGDSLKEAFEQVRMFSCSLLSPFYEADYYSMTSTLFYHVMYTNYT